MEALRPLLHPRKWIYVLRRIDKKLRVKAYSIEGNVKGSTKPLRILIILTDAPTIAYLKEKFFESEPKQIDLGYALLLKIKNQLKTLIPSYDLYIAQQNRSNTPLGYTLNYWTSCEMDLTKNLDELCKNRPNSMGYLRRRNKRRNFSYKISNSYTNFDTFFYSMHQPFIQNNFGKTAISFTYKSFKRSFPKIRLLMLHLDNEWIAAATILYNKTIRFHKLGFKQGLDPQIQKDTGAAIYYSLFENAKKENYDKINLGGSRPFLTDGVFAFKLRLGAEITPYKKKAHFFIRPIKNTPTVRLLFEQNPFLTIKHEKQAAIIAGNSQAKISKQHIKLAAEAGASAIDFYYTEKEPPLENVQHLNNTPITYRPFKELFHPLST